MDNRVLYGILTILFNQIGVPQFMQGYTKTGILYIVLGFLTCSVMFYVNAIMGIIQGIKILTMSDEEYAAADKSTLLAGFPKAKKDEAAE